MTIYFILVLQYKALLIFKISVCPELLLNCNPLLNLAVTHIYIHPLNKF